MAEPHAHSQPIQTYGPAPHNRNIWPSPTPTANQYKHMAEPHTIDYVTPGRFFCLRFWLYSNHYSHPMADPDIRLGATSCGGSRHSVRGYIIRRIHTFG